MRVGWILHFWLIKDMHFVWLEALTILVNDTVNIVLIISNIVLYYVPFIKYLFISKILLVSIGL